MKKILYTIALSFVSIMAFSQVGVNTSQPQGTFHIDATGTGTDSGSVIVTDSGNTGVGTLTPTQKLEVNGNMQVALTDSVKGNLTVDNKIIVNGNLRLTTSSSDQDLENLSSFSKLEIIGDQPKEGFRFDDGSQLENNEPTLVEMVPTFGKNTTTNLAGWFNLKSITDIRDAQLLDGVFIHKLKNVLDQDSLVDITEPSGLVLDRGIWLIMASIPTDNNGSVDGTTPTRGYYVYMHLLEDGTGTTFNAAKATIGSPTESDGGNPNGYGVSTPQLMYMLKVNNDNTTYRIRLSTSIGNNSETVNTRYRTNTAYGDPYFFAVKLDYTNQ